MSTEILKVSFRLAYGAGKSLFGIAAPIGWPAAPARRRRSAAQPARAGRSLARVWRRGRVISSWLLDSAGEGPHLKDFSGFVQDSGEGRWTVEVAVEESVPADVITSALYARFRSRQEHTFGEKMLSAMRFGFGGHIEVKSPLTPNQSQGSVARQHNRPPSSTMLDDHVSIEPQSREIAAQIVAAPSMIECAHTREQTSSRSSAVALE
jgi:hypothetical protein